MSEVPVCADCAHLIGVRERPENAKTWKCGEPRNVIDKGTDLVSGTPICEYKYSTCYDARKDDLQKFTDSSVILLSCGEKGAWFKLYERPVYTPPVSRGKPSADSLLGELGL